MASIRVMSDELKNRIHFSRAYILDRMLGEKDVRKKMSSSWFFSTDSKVQKELVEERLSSCYQVRSVNDFPPAMTRQLIDILAIQESRQCKLRALHFAFTARKNDEIRTLLNERVQDLVDPTQIDLTRDSPDHSPQNYFRAAHKLMKEMWKDYLQTPRDSKSRANELLGRERFKMLSIILKTPATEEKEDMIFFTKFIQQPQFSDIASVLRKTDNIYDQRLASLLEDMRNMGDDFNEMMQQPQSPELSFSNSHLSVEVNSKRMDLKHSNANINRMT